MDAVTGVVSVAKPLDYEQTKFYRLTLEARDHGVDPQTGSAGLEVHVRNVNEQPANITVDFRSEFKDGQVKEDTAVGSVIAEVRVSDPDSDVVRDVSISLFGDQNKFLLRNRTTLTGTSGSSSSGSGGSDRVWELVTSAGLDREVTSSYELTVVVTDAGTPPLSANRDVRITVTDVNDNPPVFSPDSLQVFLLSSYLLAFLLLSSCFVFSSPLLSY